MANSSWITIYDQALKKRMEGVILSGMTATSIGPDSNQVMQALANLKWLVVMDALPTTSSEFWRRPGVDPKSIPTEVFMSGGFGRLLMIVGAVLGLFIAGYTGVLISVSNQPVWSDTWTLGGLFLASGLSVAAAALVILARGRSDTASTEGKLSRADAFFILLELVLLVAFFVTLGALASRLLAPRWLVLWALVAIGTIIPLAMTRMRSGRRGAPVLAGLLVLIGGLALRIVVIFGAQM